jgi:ribosomal protein S18 acetylase RimI-like enzyme
MLTVRPVLMEDEDFVSHLFADARKEQFFFTGWPQEQLHVFLKMQFEAQKRSYLLQNPSAIHEIIVYGSDPIGRLITDVTDSSIHILDISLCSAYRNQGFGTHLIERLKESAISQRKNLTLYVFQNNPAQKLYLRLGFTITKNETPYDRMEWEPHSKK